MVDELDADDIPTSDNERETFVVLDAFEPFRSMMSSLVASFVSDGWTDEQARALVVHVITTDHDAFQGEEDHDGDTEGR